MLFLYNLTQLLFIFCFFPLIVAAILAKSKYRTTIPARLGLGLQAGLKRLKTKETSDTKTIWIHALSVGETTSALPLIKALHQARPDLNIVFSTTTSTGKKIAEKTIRPYTDLIINGPLDLFWVIRSFVSIIEPDLFILVETDFWPNWLSHLTRRGIPSMLVNGRISTASIASYRKYRFFFQPMFNSFSLLSMQTELDAENMKQLGVSPHRIKPLGNLKFDTQGNSVAPPDPSLTRETLGLPETVPVILCGSTHAGEETILLQSFLSLLTRFPDLMMIIAPRNIDRAGEIRNLAGESGIEVSLRSENDHPSAPVLLLDTIGELACLYHLCDLAFIGGSLVNEGGHNPLEPAAFGIPVLFGPHMEDFSEIATDLEQYGGARTVNSYAELQESITAILSDRSLHSLMSQAAGRFITDHSGVTRSHLLEIDKLLERL